MATNKEITNSIIRDQHLMVKYIAYMAAWTPQPFVEIEMEKCVICGWATNISKIAPCNRVLDQKIANFIIEQHSYNGVKFDGE